MKADSEAYNFEAQAYVPSRQSDVETDDLLLILFGDKGAHSLESLLTAPGVIRNQTTVDGNHGGERLVAVLEGESHCAVGVDVLVEQGDAQGAFEQLMVIG